MKKIIIITLATLSTGLVLSQTLRKNNTPATPKSIEIKKYINDNKANNHLASDVVATAD